MFGVLILVVIGVVKFVVFWNEVVCFYSFMVDGIFEVFFMLIGFIVFEVSVFWFDGIMVFFVYFLKVIDIVVIV